MNKARKIFATLSLSAMMFNVVVLPVAAQGSINLSVTGNGVESDNEMVVKTNQNTEVTQTNESKVTNNIKATAQTGDNSTSRNTGGDMVKVSTGDASSDVTVTNALGSNEAVVDCCSAQGITATIGGENGANGDSTDNKVVLTNDNSVKLNQENKTNVVNTVDNKSNSGWNRADRNTGATVSVETGDASAKTAVSTGGNVNSAKIGGGSGQSSVSAMIVGNGVDSDNNVVLKLDHELEVGQVNSARVVNKVDTDAVSGKNEASRNTSGDVTIDTGDAMVDVTVDNAVNFNYADVDCGCIFDVTAKIAGNGDSSDNNIKASLNDDLDVSQDNSCGYGYHHMPMPIVKYLSRYMPKSFGHGGSDCLTNDVYADAYSGWNNADRNTGPSGSDPSVETGDADTTVDVINAGNSNVYGEMPEWEIPSDNDSNVNVSISFDILSLLGMLGITVNS